MPTSEQRMSPCMKRLYRRIVAERSYSCFQERVSAEEVVKAYACALDLDACDLLRRWAGLPEAPTRKRTPPPRRGDDDLPGDDDDGPLPPDDDDEIGPSDEDDEDDVENDRPKEKRSLTYEFEEE